MKLVTLVVRAPVPLAVCVAAAGNEAVVEGTPVAVVADVLPLAKVQVYSQTPVS